MLYSGKRRLYLFLLNSLGFSRASATAVVKTAAFALNPAYGLKSRPIVDRLARSGLRLVLPEEEGYRLFRPGELSGTDTLIAECQNVFSDAKKSGQLDRKVSTVSKPFLVPVADVEHELLAREPIFDFVLSDVMMATVASYFGALPILAKVQLMWSPINDTMQKSQKYHFDTEDFRQLKVFVNISEVTTDSGPLTLIGSRRSEEISQQLGYEGGHRARLEDEVVAEVNGDAGEVVVTGLAGSGVFVDTSRCLHFGSRGNRRERLILMLQFISYYAPKIEPPDWRPVAAALPDRLDAGRRLMLRC